MGPANLASSYQYQYFYRDLCPCFYAAACFHIDFPFLNCHICYKGNRLQYIKKQLTRCIYQVLGSIYNLRTVWLFIFTCSLSPVALLHSLAVPVALPLHSFIRQEVSYKRLRHCDSETYIRQLVKCYNDKMHL